MTTPPTVRSPVSAAVAERDVAVDLLRAGALAAVVLGHWLLTVVHWQHGDLSARNLLDVAPVTQWATWLFQVLPLFFAVAGWAAARSWSTRPADSTVDPRTDRTTGRAADPVARRLRRLLVPAATYAVTAAVITAAVTGVFGDAAAPVSGLLGMHLWFLAVFVPVTAVTPWLCAQVARRGWRVPLVCGTAVVACDVTRFVVGVPAVGWANFVFVWLGFTTAGIAASFRPPRRTELRRAAAVAVGVLVALVAAGWYPHSMVGVGDRSNNTPPTVALGLLGLAQVALAAAALPRLRGWLTARPGVRRTVGTAGSFGLHAYLWHLCATVLVVAVMASGIGNVEPLGTAWWATRAVWLAVLGVVTAPIVVVAARTDLRRLRKADAAGSAPVRSRRVVAATLLASGACAALALGGVGTEPGAVAATVALVAAARLCAPARRVRPDSATSR